MIRTALGLLLTFALDAPLALAADASKPNVVYILADDKNEERPNSIRIRRKRLQKQQS